MGTNASNRKEENGVERERERAPEEIEEVSRTPRATAYSVKGKRVRTERGKGIFTTQHVRRNKYKRTHEHTGTHTITHRAPCHTGHLTSCQIVR